MRGDGLAVIDFTTVEVWAKDGLVTVYLLFGMELATRRIHFAGSTGLPPFYGPGRLRHPRRQALLLNGGTAGPRPTDFRPWGVRKSRPRVRESFVGETTTFS
jgi:hypothetical protein